MAEEQDGAEPARWSVEQRLAFAANRLFWDGAIQREDIIRRFGVSGSQATADLGRLRGELGAGIRYDVTRRAYLATDAFTTPPADAQAVLTELRLIAEGILPPERSILSAPPPLDIAGFTGRAVDEAVLRAVLRAIRDRAAIAADYVSFQRPEIARRVLSPHALVFDGFRWHARAHDAGDARFKDFVLSRLSDSEPAGPAQMEPAEDVAWWRMTTLEIVPHPGLSDHQKAVVMRDYGMIGGRLRLTVREAVAFYARKRLGLIDGHAGRPPHEQQIVLAEE